MCPCGRTPINGSHNHGLAARPIDSLLQLGIIPQGSGQDRQQPGFSSSILSCQNLHLRELTGLRFGREGQFGVGKGWEILNGEGFNAHGGEATSPRTAMQDSGRRKMKLFLGMLPLRTLRGEATAKKAEISRLQTWVGPDETWV